MYGLGFGVPQNYAEAYKWFQLAVDQGYEGAFENLDVILGVMTPDQIAEGERLVAEWRPR
jgi:TPR repeat protein